MALDPARLRAILNNTGLQIKDNPTYQFLNSLLDHVGSNAAAVKASSGSGSIGPTGPAGPKGDKGDNGIPGADGVSGDNGPPGPIGLTGATGSSGSGVPYFIASGDTFTVPVFEQTLFAITIDNEGTIDVEGYLIEVD